jgi:hypothetical protein
MLNGSCLCGAVAFETQKLSGPIVHCNCQTCRKAHSAAFATTARTERAHFEWTRGKKFLGNFESTPGKIRHFCTRCGSHLMAEWTDQPRGDPASGLSRHRSRGETVYSHLDIPSSSVARFSG